MNNIKYYQQKTGVMKSKSIHCRPIYKIFTVLLVDRHEHSPEYILLTCAQSCKIFLACYSVTQRYNKYCKTLYNVSFKEENKHNKKITNYYSTHETRSLHKQLRKCTSTECTGKLSLTIALQTTMHTVLLF